MNESLCGGNVLRSSLDFSIEGTDKDLFRVVLSFLFIASLFTHIFDLFTKVDKVRVNVGSSQRLPTPNVLEGTDPG